MKDFLSITDFDKVLFQGIVEDFENLFGKTERPCLKEDLQFIYKNMEARITTNCVGLDLN